MGVFLQVIGGLTIAGGVVGALFGLAVATPFSQAAAIISAVVWFVSGLVSGCVFIALGQLYGLDMDACAAGPDRARTRDYRIARGAER